MGKMWDDLSWEDKAAMMEVAIKNGLTSLDDIRGKYNEFAQGGSKDDDLVDWIIKEEGFLATPKNIGDGKITLGSGLTDPKWHGIYKKKGKWSEQDNRMAVAEEIANRRKWAESNVPNWQDLPDSAQKALLSYKYNYDFNRNNSPEMYKALEARDWARAAGEMNATSKNAKFREGLMNRRKREQEMFLKDFDGIHPSVYKDRPSYAQPFQPEPRWRPLTIPEIQQKAEEERQRRHGQIAQWEEDNRAALLEDMYNYLSTPTDNAETVEPITPTYKGIHYYAKGGDIHIKPENRGKFTALKKRTGHSATWFKEHGTPAQKKMATFALNARKWKHGLGGNLFENGGDTDYVANSDDVYGAKYGILPEVVVTPKGMPNIIKPKTTEQQWQKYWGDEGAASVSRAMNNAAPYVAPLVIASAIGPALQGATALGDAAYAGFKSLPIIAQDLIKGGITSIFTGHGLNHAINEGIDGWGDAAMTALELAPLGRLARPMWNAVKPTRNFIPTLESNRAGVRYAYNRNPELANIGTLEDYNDYLKTVFPESKIKDINYHMGPKGLQELKPSTGEIYNTNPDARGIYVTPDKSYAQSIRKYTTTRLENPSLFTFVKRNLIPGGWDKANDAFTDIYPVIVDAKNPLLTKGSWTWGIKDKKYKSLMNDYDAIVNSGPKWYQRFLSMPETIVPKTEQTLILGSDADVAGFRRFMSNPEITAENAASMTPKVTHFYHGSPVESRAVSPWIKELPIEEGRYYRQVRPDALESYRANGVVSQFNQYGNNPTEFDVPMFSKGHPTPHRESINSLGDIWVVSKPGAKLEWESVNQGAAMSPKFGGEFNKAPISEFDFYQYDPTRGYFKLDAELGNAPFSKNPHVDYLNSLSEQQQIEYLTQNGLNDQWLWTLKNKPDHLESALRGAPVPTDEGLVVSALPDYSGGLKTDFDLFRRFTDRGKLKETMRSVETPKKNLDVTTTFKVDPDKRFMMFEPGKFINHDLGAMSVEEVVNTFGPEAKYYKKLYDVAKANNFEGKYAQIGKDAEYNILNRFAINKADPDVAKGIAEARGIYDIPEYRARFNRWGTLGDTFVDDALARIDDVKLQGMSKSLPIKGQHGVHGGAYTSPDATTIGITNSESSSWITDMIRHETNHVGHGLKRQPDWMRYHNEKIRPVVKEGKTTDTALDKYYDEMDEIVERSKTAVEYANKIRKEGETLDQALTRLADMTEADIYNSAIPADVRQSIARYTKDSMLNFWKNFVGGYAAPVAIGMGTLGTLYETTNKLGGIGAGVYKDKK